MRSVYCFWSRAQNFDLGAVCEDRLSHERRDNLWDLLPVAVKDPPSKVGVSPKRLTFDSPKGAAFDAGLEASVQPVKYRDHKGLCSAAIGDPQSRVHPVEEQIRQKVEGCRVILANRSPRDVDAKFMLQPLMEFVVVLRTAFPEPGL